MFAKSPVAIVAALSLAAAAIAHPQLTGASPAADSSGSSPSEVSMTFSEKLIGKSSGATLTMTAMPGMSDHPAMTVKGTSSLGADGQTLHFVPARPLPAGSYRVDYHLLSAERHKLDGSYSFTVK